MRFFPHIQLFYINIYAFSRCFYPKRLTVNSDYTFFSMCLVLLTHQPLSHRNTFLNTSFTSMIGYNFGSERWKGKQFRFIFTAAFSHIYQVPKLVECAVSSSVSGTVLYYLSYLTILLIKLSELCWQHVSVRVFVSNVCECVTVLYMCVCVCVNMCFCQRKSRRKSMCFLYMTKFYFVSKAWK